MSFPVVIAQFFNVDYSTVGGRILLGLSSSNWCKPSDPILSIGLLVYILLIVAFAYFYTSITFNPIEIADNMKKQGGFIPGIRRARPTSDYLKQDPELHRIYWCRRPDHRCSDPDPVLGPL